MEMYIYCQYILHFINSANKKTCLPVSQHHPVHHAIGIVYLKAASCLRHHAGAFRKAVERAKLSLPRGQLTHVLRHTFASHFMMNGGNILALQKILGHSSLAMTMRYAHLAPEHLQEAKRLNPLARLTLG